MNTKNKTLETLNKYIDFECNLTNCEPKDTTVMLRIQSFIDYRNTRVKQKWYSEITHGKNDRNIAIERNNLDRERRENHNKALISLSSFNDIFVNKFGLEPLYEGNLLTPEQIKAHAPECYDTRMEMTDFFLGFIKEITNYNTREIENPKVKDFYESLKDNVCDFERDFGVKENLEKDDGDIKLKDDNRNNYEDPII